jgi:hypothetical protein
MALMPSLKKPKGGIPPPWLIDFGKPGAVRKDLRRRIGFAP